MSEIEISGNVSATSGRSMLRRFRRSKDGATAIEFAALAMPFLLLAFAILESCIGFAAQQAMANISDDVARQVRTGQPELKGITESALEDIVCNRLAIVTTNGCKTRLSIDLRSFTTFQAAAAAAPLKFTADNDIDTSEFAVSPGGSMTTNMIRMVYRWPVMVDFLRASMGNIKGNDTLFFATTTWLNEPFDN